MTPDDLVAVAARLKALERVAAAADTFLQHIAGFRLHIDAGPVDVFNEHMPEAIALRQALDTWHATQGERRP